MSEQDSCIIRYFNHYATLSARDKELLWSLERSPVEVGRSDLLWKEGDRADHFCTLSEGWAYSCRHLEDGSRQILEVFLPGDIIGLREFAFQERLTTVEMIGEGVICRFPHRHLVDVFHESGTLSTIFFAISSHHQAMLTERLVNLARRTARHKIAHFLYELYMRLLRTQSAPVRRFRLPLSQQQIGDALGLSAVHVSRTFTVFREEGLVLRERQWIDLPDPEALAREASFIEHYLDDNVSHLFERTPPNPAIESVATDNIAS
ncbi:Crp/Fnr family transcriptional regulator [Halomonas sp. WWR20]